MGAEAHNRNTFNKVERLSSKKIIASLFEAGQSFLSPPLRVVHLKITPDNTTHVKLAISVPKKNFPNATDRNRIKRLIREAYRKNKHALSGHLQQRNIYLAVILIYTGTSVTTFNLMEDKIKLVLNRLMQEYEAGA